MDGKCVNAVASSIFIHGRSVPFFYGTPGTLWNMLIIRMFEFYKNISG
jgi:hypothetical protein